MPTLQALIKDIHIPTGKKHGCTVCGLSYDSRTLRKGDLFFALSGEHVDGAQYIGEAIAKGASAVIIETKSRQAFKSGVPVLYVKNIRACMAQAAEIFYKHPSKNIAVIGVTGTNGKTTITYLLEHILQHAGYTCGVIGTINYRYNGKSIKAVTTTPQAIDVQSLLKEMSAYKVDHVCMEVSSHALTLQRVAGIRFRGVIFTNLTRDHIDFHGSMMNYYKAKRLLFSGTHTKFAIINTDDSYGRRLRAYCKFPVVTYGLHRSQDVYAHSVRLYPSGSEFILRYKDREYALKIHLIGEYNVYNALAAVGAAIQLGVVPETVVEGLASLHGIPGRMEKIHSLKSFTVIVDYAHTNDALLNVLKTIVQLNPHRILTVFGCGGDRDRKKRPIMGRIAVEMSHHAWITLDNPRSEDPARIMNDILHGIKKTKKHNYSVVYDRRKAIKSALQAASAGDVVLIAGKGHEKYQILKDKTIPFDDKQVVLDIIGS